MTYSLEHIVGTLKMAREGQGLSQRELSAMAGVPQAHISKIENASVDLKVSSLVELARVLGLEVMLVPRALVPAVQTITGSAGKAGKTPAGKELKQLRDLLADWHHPQAGPREDWLELQKTVGNLANISLGPGERDEVRRVLAVLRRARKLAGNTDDVMLAARRLRNLRNRVVHNIAEPDMPPRPAYTLDDESDDA